MHHRGVKNPEQVKSQLHQMTICWGCQNIQILIHKKQNESANNKKDQDFSWTGFDIHMAQPINLEEPVICVR